MPFMIGKSPIRRTLKYLQAGKLVLKESIQIMTINYNTFGNHHEGARQFIFWHLGPLQYKNPHVQILPLRNLTPSPFIQFFYGNGREMLIDIDSKSKDEILDHLVRVVGKSEQLLQKEEIMSQKKENPANIGNGCSKHCICEVPGQLPCPSVVPLPYHMRGKYIRHQNP